MSKLKRRLFFLFFAGLFFISVPLVIFFAQGYRFDLVSGIFVHSGSIAIKSWPKDIEVYLDGKKYETKKSGLTNEIFIINGLRPGSYQLKCQKNGYIPWEKKVQVHSGISTEFWNVLLFPLPNNAEKIVYPLSQKVSRFFLSPRSNNEVVFLKKENGLNFIQLLDFKESILEEAFSTKDYQLSDPQNKENVEWNPEHELLLMPLYNQENKKEYFIQEIIDQEQGAKQAIRLLDFFEEKTDLRKARWMYNKNDELVVLTEKHELFYLNIKKPEEKILLDNNVSDFDFAGNRIYYAQNPNNLVWEIKDNDISTKRQITKTAFAQEKETFIDLTVYDEYRLTMLNDTGSIFIFNQEKEKNEITNEEILGEFTGSQFTNDGKKLLFWSEHEIWALYLRNWEVQPLRNKGEKNLVTRFSQVIKNVQWMESYENIIFTAGRWIQSAEIDFRDRNNLMTLLEGAQDWQENEVLYDKESQILFYLSKESGKENVLNSMLLVDKTDFLGF